jgi:hypothetical protein
MEKHVLVLTTSAFILVCGAITASAQQSPGSPMQPDQQQTQRIVATIGQNPKLTRPSRRHSITMSLTSIG